MVTECPRCKDEIVFYEFDTGSFEYKCEMCNQILRINIELSYRINAEKIISIPIFISPSRMEKNNSKID